MNRSDKKTRVLVITGDHARPDPTKWDGGYTDADFEMHEKMQRALAKLTRYDFDYLADHDELLPRLQNDPPDLVFNLCDTGFRNVATNELCVPAFLEAFGIGYTGAPPASMVLCYDKAIVRLIARAHGVAVPDEVLVPPGLSLDSVRIGYPAIVKPATGDGSVGINRGAVVRSDEELRRQLDWFRGELPGHTAIVQEFLPGAEYGVALVGNPGAKMTMFPPLVVDYTDLEPGLPPILAFESKTGPDTPYNSVRIEQAKLDKQTLATLRASCETLFERLQCRDYARFDFRTGQDGAIKLMEVNPNPAWSEDAKLAMMAAFGGTGYGEMLSLLLDVAQERIKKDRAES